MSFSGKKFRRVRSENIEDLGRVANMSENILQMLNSSTPTFCFTQIDGSTYNYCLESNGRVNTHDFKLGEEHEVARRDGSKVMVTYTLESENVLSQVIRQPDGKQSYFRRVFGDKETTMTIRMDGTDIEAKIYYELAE
ncbi:fatty acid-binding protein Fh15-like isoform X2 [Anticarsia gemmatalis]|uniref:fatty acid-binding protein Fh15-like isoform X2 n=1 Tax=Anticarsia gemmatalis TaxID=129554 RepID=UPI003F75B568